MASPVLAALRVQPFRGDTVAAGAVVLATLVALLDARDDWADGVQLAVAAAAGLFVAAVAVLSPVEGRDPRVYQTVLFVTTVVLVALTVFRVAELLEAEGAGAVTWQAVAIAAPATWFARKRGSGTCALLAATAGGIAVLAAVDWLLGWDSANAIRWMLLLLTAVFALSAVTVRDRRPRSAAMLAVAGGFSTLGIAATFVVELLVAGIFAGFADVEHFAEQGGGSFLIGGPAFDGTGTGWILLVLAAGFGLCAYSGVERQPGPAYVGVANLVAFLVLAADDGSLVGWPLVLALGAGALLVIGLRPARPLPPPPEATGPAPPNLPLPGPSEL
ncbi:hypothetical protein [Conexibacter sp. SYSU D00693]|uniref:hypothetical protein n=1 Tax=Conexibacter sp. SYSU D00693 TaxID=2812560 RepID=UPI00196B4F0F|nr:hypothetical protein [Conexibacter sp. SYSU D00693]